MTPIKYLLNIPLLTFGGLITNYSCTSNCAHCLYRCGPHRQDEFITAVNAYHFFTRIKLLGCQSLHVGGGESFLHPNLLRSVLDAAQQAGITIEYIETNAAWFTTEENAVNVLRSLVPKGLYALLVSISPFHNESIPYYKTQGLIKAAARTGIHVIPWVEQLQGDLETFDTCAPHLLDEYTQQFGKDYIATLPRRYWIHFGGRALNTYRSLLPTITLDEILVHSRGGCRRELTNTSHFHVDLHGNYIPGLCIGIAIRLQDLPGPLDPERYPLLYTLAERGINGLYDLAVEQYGFTALRKSYLGKCDLCDEVRTFLARQHSFHELQPAAFYQKTPSP